MDALASSFLPTLAVTHRESVLAFERATGVSETRLRILTAIAIGKRSMRAIEQWARVDQSVLSRMMKSLEQEGLVARIDPEAYRDRDYQLSPSGKLLYRSLTAKRSHFEKVVLKGVSEDELALVTRILNSVRSQAEGLNGIAAD